jgi:hypothetical protein
MCMCFDFSIIHNLLLHIYFHNTWTNIEEYDRLKDEAKNSQEIELHKNHKESLQRHA